MGVASIIDELISQSGGNLMTPSMASPVERGRTQLEMMMARPDVAISQPSGTVMNTTTFPGEVNYTASTTPQVQAAMQGLAFGGVPSSEMPATTERTVNINPPKVAPLRSQIADMGGAGVLAPGADTKLAEQAAQVVELEKTNPEIVVNPSFMSTVKDYFGDRENMLRLALAFNTMRLQPDQGLASALNSELQDLRKTKRTGKTVGAIVSFLRSKGYEEYAKVAEQNPEIAGDIYEQVIQKELKPGAAAKTSGVQYDNDGKAFVVVSEDGKQRIDFLKDAQGNQIRGDSLQDKQEAELAAAKYNAQLASSQKYSDAALKKADVLGEQLILFGRAIELIDEGAETGPVNQFLPTVRSTTRELETIAAELGITVINSATFGALSESELRLALDTNLPLNLDGAALKKFLKRKKAAVTKLRAELLGKAADMRTMGYDKFLEKQRQEAEENVRFLSPPADFQPVGGVQWDDMTLQQKRQYMELGQ